MKPLTWDQCMTALILIQLLMVLAQGNIVKACNKKIAQLENQMASYDHYYREIYPVTWNLIQRERNAK